MRNKKTALLFCTILLFLSFTIPSYSKEYNILTQAGTLDDIIISKEQNTLEVKILLTRYTKSDHFKLARLNRIVIDFFGVKNITASRRIDVYDFGISTIRTGMFKPDIARVVFDLEETIPLYQIEDIQGGMKVLFWREKVPEVMEEEAPPEAIQEEDAIARMNVRPDKANLNDPVVVDMSGSENAHSMEIDVFNAEGVKIDTLRLTPESSRSEITLDKPGRYTFKGRAFNISGKPSENLCEAIVHINSPPICKLESLYYEDYAGKTFTLDASGSEDPDGEVVKAHFEVIDKAQNSLDRLSATKKPFIWKRVFKEEGIYTVAVIVTDDFGAESEPSEAQVVVMNKRVFWFVDAGVSAASGNSYGGYAATRVGMVIKISRTLDYTLSGGGGLTIDADPWTSYFMANMLFNVHAGPVYFGAGAGVTSGVREDRNPDGEIVANVGVEVGKNPLTKRSFFFEVRAPIGKDRVFSEHHKLMIGFKFLF